MYRKTLLQGVSAIFLSAALVAAFFIGPFNAGATNTASINLDRSIGQYLEAPDSGTLSVTGNFTVEFWVKFASLPSTGLRTIYSKKGSGQGNLAYETYIGNNGTNHYLLLQLGQSPGNFSSTAIVWDPTVNTWNHVAVVYDTSGTVNVYVNGVLQGTATGLATQINDTDGVLRIGQDTDSNGFFDGKIDDFRIWNIARTQPQIAANMSQELTGNESGLVAYWQLNNNLVDLTINGNTLANANGAGFSSDIPFPVDTVAPSISITAPTNGSTVSGTISLTASSTDNVAVAGVQFKVDGSNFGSEDTSAPYSITLDTSSLANGGHNVSAQARDTSNNTTTSATVNITVNNPPAFTEILKVRKSTNESVTSTNTVQNDDELKLALAANKTYIIDGVIFASSNNGTPDLNFGLFAQSGSAVVLGFENANTEAVLGNGTLTGRIPLVANVQKAIHIRGTIKTGATSGDFQLKWAQNTSNSHPTTILEGSYLRAEEI